MFFIATYKLLSKNLDFTPQQIYLVNRNWILNVNTFTIHLNSESQREREITWYNKCWETVSYCNHGHWKIRSRMWASANSPWDLGQIGIKLEAKHVIYQKLAHFYVEKGYLCQQAWKCRLWHVTVYVTHQKLIQRGTQWNWIWKVLKCKNKMYQWIELKE